MKYQQISITRLADAGKKLLADCDWHAFSETTGSFYRVCGRIVQRVHLEPNEDKSLLVLLHDFEPFPSRVLREGFREELCFRIEDDRYELCNIYLRIFLGWELLARAGKKLGVTLDHSGGNSLLGSVRIEEWTSKSCMRAVLLAKALGLVATDLLKDAQQGIPHIETEVQGLLRTAFEMLLEETNLEVKADGGRKKTKRIEHQTSLFQG